MRATKTSSLARQARETLKKINYKEVIPLEQAKWAKFLINLRKSTGLTQVEFWGLVDVKAGTGSKYEMFIEGSQRRTCPPDVMYKLSDILDLTWESRIQIIADGSSASALKVSTEGEQILNYIEKHNIKLSELELLVDLRQRALSIWLKP